MSNKQRSLTIMVTLVIVSILISGCVQPLSQAPAATPTLITELFVSPLPSAENPLAMIEEFARQTSAAQTVAAGGVVTTGTPDPAQVLTTGTVITPQSGTTGTPAADSGITGTPTNANIAAATTAVPAATTAVVATGPTITPLPAGVRPATYTLQAGEFPYCIARRFNVDPTQLLQLSGLSEGVIYPAGTALKIPQSGAFPGDRMLATHPATYTVASSDETIYSIACIYGDVDPAAIASANGISASAVLTVGQLIKVP
jgi:LysM repeat protein